MPLHELLLVGIVVQLLCLRSCLQRVEEVGGMRSGPVMLRGGSWVFTYLLATFYTNANSFRSNTFRSQHHLHHAYYAYVMPVSLGTRGV